MTDCEQGNHHFFAPLNIPPGIYTCIQCPAQVEVRLDGCWLAVQAEHNQPLDDCPERCW